MSLHINGAAFGGCQVETGTVRTGYQAATSAYDVSEAGYGYIWGLRTDGIDDWLATQVINWGTDEVTVVAAVRKNSDASEGSIMAFTGGGAGEFRMVGPGGNTSFKFWSASKGATETFAVASSGAYSAPISAVVSMQGKIGTDTNNLWINGTLAATSSGDQGVAATYGKHQLRIGRLSGTSFPFNGMIYGLMVINRLLTPTERSRAERYMAALSGVTIP